MADLKEDWTPNTVRASLLLIRQFDQEHYRELRAADEKAIQIALEAQEKIGKNNQKILTFAISGLGLFVIVAGFVITHWKS